MTNELLLTVILLFFVTCGLVGWSIYRPHGFACGFLLGPFGLILAALLAVGEVRRKELAQLDMSNMLLRQLFNQSEMSTLCANTSNGFTGVDSRLFSICEKLDLILEKLNTKDIKNG